MFRRSINLESKRRYHWPPESNVGCESLTKFVRVGLRGRFEANLSQHLGIFARCEKLLRRLRNLLDNRLRRTGWSEQSVGTLVSYSGKSSLYRRGKLGCPHQRFLARNCKYAQVASAMVSKALSSDCDDPYGNMSA